ncbi:MAG: ATPase, partial [Leptospiraceae bacterium]|nr:ATPase [Leptospiraceae bacterium]
DTKDPIYQLETEFKSGLEGLGVRETETRLKKIEAIMQTLSEGKKVYGHNFDDILKLKYLHQRYTNYLNWAKWKNT